MVTEIQDNMRARSGFTIQEKAEILMEAGIHVVQWHEANDSYFPWPHIQFDGDEGEGFKASSAFIERGIPIVKLHREWLCGSRGFNRPTWVLYFHRNL